MKNKHILNFLSILTMLTFLIYLGCTSIDPSLSTDIIIARYTQEYIETSNIDTNTDNHDIAAMLQTITVDLIRKPSETWRDVDIREQRYIDLVKTNYISQVYTLYACSNEIRIVDGFCDNIIYYYSQIESGYASFAGSFLGESAKRFIVNMDNYEYEKVQTIQTNSLTR